MSIDKEYIETTIDVVNDMNQRGGRMLSIIDLIDAKTISSRCAAYLTCKVLHGSSLGTCAKIGGTGKTTLLAALLAILPERYRIITVTSENLSVLLKENGNTRSFQATNFHSTKTGSPSNNSKTIYLCHEISPATGYYSYLWGHNINRYLSLVSGNKNSSLAFTIHADEPGEVYPQIINSKTGLKHNALSKINLLVFIKNIRIEKFNNYQNYQKRLTYIYEWDKIKENYILMWKWEKNNDQHINIVKSNNCDEREINRIESIFNAILKQNIKSIEKVRKTFLDYLQSKK